MSIGKTKLGSGGFGIVYDGRAWFVKENKTIRKRVAIKIFGKKIDESRVQEYEQVIERLAKQNVKLPKTVFHKLPSGEWVQVQELFMKQRASKLKKTFLLMEPLLNEVEAERHGLIVAQLLNAGYDPYAVKDSVDRNREEKPANLWVRDFDCFIPENEDVSNYSEPTAEGRVTRIVSCLRRSAHPVIFEKMLGTIFKNLTGNKERKAMTEAAKGYGIELV